MNHRKSDKADKSKGKRTTLDEAWPVHSAGSWPQDLSLDRSEIYEGRT